VLVRPQLGENIGKAARADEVLAGARVFATVAEAVADCALVYATTVRKRGLVIPVQTPEEAAREMHDRDERCAVLFGAERSGLETEETAIASRIITVPINPDFRSLNLAQAVILVAYEWSKPLQLAMPTEGEPPEPRASQNQLEGLIGQLDEALDKAGYFFPADRTPATRNTMRTILSKAGWSNREIQALRGMIRALVDPRQR
jgi:tRNA/rRNA methyltransferase